MKNNQQGLGLPVILILVLVVGVIGVVSWYVKRTKATTAKNNNQTVSQQTTLPKEQSQGSDQNPHSNVSAQATVPPATTATPALTLLRVRLLAALLFLYRILADGTPQVSPVTTSLTNVSSVELTIDFSCLGPCNFKLVSDDYTLANASTYSSSQKIKYTVSKPGSYFL